METLNFQGTGLRLQLCNVKYCNWPGITWCFQHYLFYNGNYSMIPLFKHISHWLRFLLGWNHHLLQLSSLFVHAKTADHKQTITPSNHICLGGQADTKCISILCELIIYNIYIMMFIIIVIMFIISNIIPHSDPHPPIHEVAARIFRSRSLATLAKPKDWATSVRESQGWWRWNRAPCDGIRKDGIFFFEDTSWENQGLRCFVLRICSYWILENPETLLPTSEVLIINSIPWTLAFPPTKKMLTLMLWSGMCYVNHLAKASLEVWTGLMLDMLINPWKQSRAKIIQGSKVDKCFTCVNIVI